MTTTPHLTCPHPKGAVSESSSAHFLFDTCRYAARRARHGAA